MVSTLLIVCVSWEVLYVLLDHEDQAKYLTETQMNVFNSFEFVCSKYKETIQLK
jgi:hypothetical protein